MKPSTNGKYNMDIKYFCREENTDSLNTNNYCIDKQIENDIKVIKDCINQLIAYTMIIITAVGIGFLLIIAMLLSIISYIYKMQ